jgi:2-dehydro-3-deoxyphosphogluconate aldolase/(4S)-4-hydroxy-2-oxoglutarate aldolase
LSTELENKLENIKVVAIIQADEPVTALKTTEALLKGGLDVLEVVLRTDAAIDCIRQMVAEFPDASIGAGTVLNVAQAQQVQEAGAGFLVSPGLDRKTVRFAQRNELPIYPGVATATEVQRA